ncbi:MAG: glycosyltransferase family 4 protein [Pseudomonadota bacterium]
MNFAFCLYKFFPYGGLERDFLRIAQACRLRGHTIDIYTIEWEGEVPENLNLHILPVSHWSNHGRNRGFVKALAPRLEQGHYDVVVGFNKMPGLDIYYAADPCYVAKVRCSRPWYYRLMQRYRHFAAYEEAVFGPASHAELMMISEVEQGHFMRYYGTPQERFHLLPPGIARDRVAPENAAEIRAEWRREFNVQADEKVIVMVGSAFKRKGLDRAMRGVASLPEALRQNTRLFVVGKDNPVFFQRLAEKLGISDQVEFFLGRDDVPRFLLGADIFMHPAYSENTGTVILEALVAGLPALVTDVCGYAFHVTRARAGRVIPSPFRQEDLNHLLLEMLTCPDPAKWSKNGIAYGMTEDLYSLPDVAADLIEAVGRKKRASFGEHGQSR